MRRFIIPAALGLALVACQDQSPDVVRNVIPAQHSFTQSAHFFFLTPLAPNPNATGTFNPGFFPVAEICKLSGPNGTCVSSIGTFTRDGGTKNEAVFVVSGSHYGLNWDTGAFGIANGTYARLTVRSAPGGGRVFGIVDMYLDTNGKNLSNAPNFGAVGVRNGSTLSVKFVMENGIFCGSNPDCFEGTITSKGGTFKVPSGTAGLKADSGDIKTGESANLVIERYRGPDPCLPTDFPQYESCIRIKVEGTVTTLNSLVDVGFCLEQPATDFTDQLEVAKWDEVDPATLKVLSQTDVSGFITCSGFSSAPLPTGQLARFAAATGRLLKPIASILGVKSAYAATTGPGPIPFGAGMSDFSRVGTMRPLDIAKISGDNQSVASGQAVTPTVKVTSHKTGAPVAGIPVTFNVTAGGGSVTPASATTDLNGLASASWTFGDDANSLRVDAINPLPNFPNRPSPAVFGSVVFNGTGLKYSLYKALILPPIGTNVGTNPAKYATGVPATVSICLVDTGTNACTSTVYGPFTLVDDLTKYSANWNTPTNLIIGGIYRITVTLAGSFVLSSYSTDIMPLAGGKAKNLNTGTEFSFQIGSNQPLKFSIERP